LKEIILSVGIDIGTSTTQMIFSKLTVENRAGSYMVPRVEIVEKEVVYRSGIYNTPLISDNEIDAGKVKDIVVAEYAKAGVSPENVKTGAVIITGETARKQNANQVLGSMSSLAGDFVVATAGPDLEAVLSAKGAGADKLSEENRSVIANLDIGGGTTNIALFEKGRLRSTCCLDIGGRLIKVERGIITYIYPKIQLLAKRHSILIEAGEMVRTDKINKICDIMAEHLAQAVYLTEQDDFHKSLYTNGGRQLAPQPRIEGIAISGGVADLIDDKGAGDDFRYGDIGVFLGRAIARSPSLSGIRRYLAKETIRATVVGAGTHTTEVSGSTIAYSKGRLPVKNIPILKISEEEEASLNDLKGSIKSQLPMYMIEGQPQPIAVALAGYERISFSEIQNLAQAILDSAVEVVQGQYPLIVVLEADIGKALGNALLAKLRGKSDVICIDRIHTQNGDYIDIGEPIADGQVVPVVIKTLIFNS